MLAGSNRRQHVMPTPTPSRLQALRGTRVLSLCLNLPGPAALMRLRAMGARCVKIEPIANLASPGDPMRQYSPGLYAAMHQGIRVYPADLKSQPGQKRLRQELAKADVLMTSFRPSALKRLGLDWEVLRRDFPRLCMVSIVGEHGPAAEHPGHDLTYLAQSDLVPDLSLPASLFADMAGSILASEAVLQLILHRHVTEKSKGLTVALADAAKLLALPRQWQLTGKGSVLGGRHAGYRIYRCSDGRVAVAALEPHFSRALCEASEAPWHDVTQMLKRQLHQHLERYFQDKTCAQIRRWASRHDIPLWVMPAPA